MIDIEKTFELFEDEYLQEAGMSSLGPDRPDLSAMILLNKLVPGQRDMVAQAAVDEIWLDTPIFDLAKVATREDIRHLIRLGVRYDAETESLAMFV